jgi:hypothetical protein
LSARWRYGWGLRSGSTPRKNDSSARVLTMTTAAELIRATVKNRFDNQLRAASVAIHCRRRSDRYRAVFSLRVSRREQSLRPQPHRRRVTARGSPGGPGEATCSRREGAVSKSGLEAQPASSPVIRH